MNEIKTKIRAHKIIFIVFRGLSGCFVMWKKEAFGNLGVILAVLAIGLLAIKSSSFNPLQIPILNTAILLYSAKNSVQKSESFCNVIIDLVWKL